MNSSSTSSTPSVKLLERAREGDADSLGLLLRKYFRYLNSLSRQHTDERIRMRVSPSDVVQETLLEAHRDFAGFAGASIEEFTGWLRKILFNNLATAIENHVLTAKRDIRKQRSLDLPVGDASHAPDQLKRSLEASISSPSAPVHRDESLRHLMAAISQLPDAYQQVIKLRHFENLSFAEIAAKLGRSAGATRMLWVRAVEKLKHEMSQDDESQF